LLPASLSEAGDYAYAPGIFCTTIIDECSMSLQIEDGGALDRVVAGSNVRGTLSAKPSELGSTLKERQLQAIRTSFHRAGYQRGLKNDPCRGVVER
jgi:hypothetical protein